jgi:nucleotide-binding universal stress UspA family protein
MRDTTMTAIDTREGSVGPTEMAIDGKSPVYHVLLATDLSESSGRATEKAITLAACQNAVLQILAVARTYRDRERVERGVELLRRRARSSGVVATSMVWHGDPADAIVEATWTERPDVLVVGARQHRWMARLLGSVSSKVAGEAPCRVEVVPAA